MAHVGMQLPKVAFQTRVRDESIEGPNPFRWEQKKQLTTTSKASALFCSHCQVRSPQHAQLTNCQTMKNCSASFRSRASTPFIA